MTEDKPPLSGGSPFNLDALEKMDSRKTRSVRPSKPVNYHEARSITKPGKKFDPLKQPNPWSRDTAAEIEKKPDADKKLDSLDASPGKEYPVKEAEPSESVIAFATDSTEDTISPEKDSAPAPVSTENAVSSEEDKKSRIVESVIEHAGADMEKEKVKRVSRFTDEAIKEIVTDKAAKKSGKKTLRVEVVTLGSGIASTIGKGINGAIDTGKTVAGAAGSGAKAAVDIVETGVKSVSEVVKGAVQSSKPSKEGANEELKEKSALSDSAKMATELTESVADGVLAVGSCVGRMTGYIVSGAVAAPVDIIRGVSGVLVNTTSRVARLFVGSKKSGRND